MSCNVLHFELTDGNVFKDLGFFIDGKLQGYSFVLQKIQTHKTSVLVHKKLARNCLEQWTFGLQ